jgi:hypothetical protein
VRRLALLLVLLALAAAGCGGDDDDGGGGPGDAAADIESCLQDADLDVRDRDVTELDEELVAAGATKQFVAIDVNQQAYQYEVAVFSAPEKASAYAKKQQAEFDEQPQLKFQVDAFGANAVTTTSDAPKRKDVNSCAEEGG